MRHFFVSKQFSQDQGKPRLPQEDCAWRPVALLGSVFFQTLREP
jgi:hypothetical protein